MNLFNPRCVGISRTICLTKLGTPGTYPQEMLFLEWPPNTHAWAHTQLLRVSPVPRAPSSSVQSCVRLSCPRVSSSRGSWEDPSHFPPLSWSPRWALVVMLEVAVDWICKHVGLGTDARREGRSSRGAMWSEKGSQEMGAWLSRL